MKTLLWISRRAAAAACIAAALGASTLSSHAADVAQATPAQGTAQLLLNGTGVRGDAAAGLYAATLHLEHKTSEPADVMLNRGTTQFRLVMLKDVKATQLTELLTQGLIANANDDDLITLVSEIFEVGMLLSEQGTLAAGDSIEVVSHPARGTTVSLQTAAPSAQSFANPRFLKVMMGIWLGEHPADPVLKRALLGQSS